MFNIMKQDHIDHTYFCKIIRTIGIHLTFFFVETEIQFHIECKIKYNWVSL